MLYFLLYFIICSDTAQGTLVKQVSFCWTIWSNSTLYVNKWTAYSYGYVDHVYLGSRDFTHNAERFNNQELVLKKEQEGNMVIFALLDKIGLIL